MRQPHCQLKKLQKMEFTNNLLPVTASTNHIWAQEELEDHKRISFIESNTIPIKIDEIKSNHIIPVFVKDNEPLISHADFIETTFAHVSDFFNQEQILKPDIRVSHPIKGRIPEAKDKPAHQLLDWEKTIYYERMAFVIEVPTIST